MSIKQQHILFTSILIDLVTHITFEIIVVKTMHNALYIKPNQLNKIKVSILMTGKTIRYEFL